MTSNRVIRIRDQKEDNLRRQVARLSKVVAQRKPEIKYLDSTLTTSNITSASGASIHLTAIAAGTGVNQRIGEHVRVVHMEFHMEVLISSSLTGNTADSPSYRAFLVQDTQQIADTSPTLSDLVDQPSTPVYQLFNVNEQKRLRVLYDSGPQMLVFGSTGTPTNSSCHMEGKFHLHFLRKNASIETIFNGVNGTDIQKNGLYFIVSTDVVGAAGVGLLDIAGSARIGYTDS